MRGEERLLTEAVLDTYEIRGDVTVTQILDGRILYPAVGDVAVGGFRNSCQSERTVLLLSQQPDALTSSP